MSLFSRMIQRLLARKGYKLQKIYPSANENDFARLHGQVRNFTKTSYERQHALYDAVTYIVENDIEGDIVECGVWKGGSMMLAARMLKDAGRTDRKLYLYDTFAGMTEPTEKDVNYEGKRSWERWKEQERGELNEWDYASLDEVRKNMLLTGYPADGIVFVQGPVEKTIPHTLPKKIALLRLDTDWYESTRHELEHLFPLLSKGGVLIIDDYGHWKGARQAVDEYLKKTETVIFLNRIDYTGRIAIK